jgi:hypothetical protein
MTSYYFLRPIILSQQTSAVKAEPRIKPWVNTNQLLIIFSFPGFLVANPAPFHQAGLSPPMS